MSTLFCVYELNSRLIVKCRADLVAIAREDNWNHSSLRVIINHFTEVYTTTYLVSRVALWTKWTTMSVGLE